MGQITPIPGFSEPVSSLLHLGAAACVLVYGPSLLRRCRGNRERTAAAGVYLFGVLFLFAMSGVYHLLEPGGGARAVLRRIDHAAIWILIASSFTAIHIILFDGIERWGVLSIVWILAITGLTLKTIFFHEISEGSGLFFYMILGWLGVITGYQLIHRAGMVAGKLLIFGGISYSLGAVCEFARFPVLVPRVIGPHELFHLAVMGGAALHWRLVVQLLDRYPAGPPRKINLDAGLVDPRTPRGAGQSDTR